MKHSLNQALTKEHKNLKCTVPPSGVRGLNLQSLVISLIILALFGTVQAEEKVQIKNMLEYTGRYIFPENNIAESLTVEQSNNLLKIVSSIGSADLKFIGDDSFEIPEYGGNAIFIIDETTQKVVGIKVSIPMGNIDLEGVKEETKELK